MTTPKSSPAIPDARLMELLDRQSITEVLYRYARACDRLDEPMLRSCFHPDSRHRHGSFDGLSSDFCGHAANIIRGVLGVRHAVTNVLIELEGDQAWSECLYDAWHLRPDASGSPAHHYFNAGRYLDRFERRDGNWRIVSRLGLVDYERLEAVDAGSLRTLPSSALGQRAPQDPLYQHMPSLST